MESECSCPTCLKIFSKTNKLPCGHVFCTECVTKTELQAQKEKTQPGCPFCLKEFMPASEGNPHPNSPYHDELISRCDPKKLIECVDCGGEPTLVCKDGCGLICDDCQEKHHTKQRRTASHKVMTLLEAGTTNAVDHRECILHKLPITSVCCECWPQVEMCSTCGFEDLKKNKTHESIDIERIEYATIKEDELVEQLEARVIEVADKKERIEHEMKKLTKEEERRLSEIEKIYSDIVMKATKLKENLTEIVLVQLQPASDMVKRIRDETEKSENILKHSIMMLKEAKEIYQRENVISKLFKSATLGKKVVEMKIKDMENVADLSLMESISLDGDVLIDSNKAHLLGKMHENIISKYDKCVLEIERLKKENCEQQRLLEKLTESNAAIEKAKTTVSSFSEHQQAIERNTMTGKEKEYDQLQREKMGLDIFQKIWKHSLVDYKFIGKVGSQGGGNLQFNNPWGIAVHPKNGLVYITEYSNNRVQVLDENLKFVRVFGTDGYGPGEFKGPIGISISPSGQIAVAERDGNRIQIFDDSHFVIATIRAGQKKSRDSPQATEFDGFLTLRYISFDSEGNLYVANRGKNRIDKFNAQFEFERSFAQSSLGVYGVASPDGICMTSNNEVCVVGYCGDRINIYDKNGRFIRTFRIQKLLNNASIAEGPNNTIVVSDAGSHQIRAYESGSGKIIHTIGSPKPSSADGLMNYPTGICFGANQKLYICEYGNNRIQVFFA